MNEITIVKLNLPSFRGSLALRHTPRLLRFVCAARHKWDALDQPDDVPADGEKIVVGVMADRCIVHVGHAAKCRRLADWYLMVTYDPVAEQPPDDVVRQCRHGCSGMGKPLPGLERGGDRDAERQTALRSGTDSRRIATASALYAGGHATCFVATIRRPIQCLTTERRRQSRP